MEVHAHTHTSRKKWTHYLWEFLMLFLAVFCGFLAENFREHQVEHKREKQYMQSLLSDLSSDTANINHGIPPRLQRIAAIDTVFMFFNENHDAKTISGKLFRTIRRTNYDIRIARNTVTIDQLKNAGNMRLVRNKEVGDSISAYDLHFEQLSLYFDFYLVNSQIGNRQFEKLFTASDLLHLYIANTSQGIVANIPDSLVIRINTGELNEQLNFMMLEKAYARQEINRYTELKQAAIGLMELIKREYHLK